MLDLTRQLAHLGAHLDAAHPTPDAAAVFREAERRELNPDGEVGWPLEEFVPPTRLEPLPPRRPRRRWVAAAAAAAVVLVLIGGIGLLARAFRTDTDVTETTTTVTTTTSAPTTTLPDGEPGAFVGASNWQLVTGAEGGFGGTEWLHGAAALESGFLMWGVDEGAGTMWFSGDGMSWSEVHRVPGAWFGDVAEVPQGLIAVGFSPCRDDACAFAPTLWASVDGTTWEISHRFEEANPGRTCCGFSGIEAVGSRLVAIAGDVMFSSSEGVTAGCGGPGGSCTVSSWTSDDGGATWSQHPLIQGRRAIFDLVAGGPGLVAVGATSIDDGQQEVPTVWHSADGEGWTAVESPGAADLRGLIVAGTAGGPGVVAVGRSDGSAPTVWTSADGLNWTITSPTESITGWLWDVVGLPSGSVVAVGQNCDPADVRAQCGAGVWNSPDGVSWLRVAHDESVFLGGNGGFAQMAEVATGPLGLFAVGMAEEATAWVATTAPIRPATTSTTTTTEAPSSRTGDAVPAQELSTVIAVGGEPTTIAYGDGAVWISNGTRDTFGDEGLATIGSGAISRIDPATNEVVATLEMGTRVLPGEGERAFEPNSVAAGQGSVWVGSELAGVVRRLDPATMQFTGDWVQVGWPAKVAVGQNAAWTLGYGDNNFGTVLALDALEGNFVAEIPVAQNPNYGIATGGGAVWALIWTDESFEPAVVKIDAASGEHVATINVFPADPIWGYTLIAFGERSLWVTGGDMVDGGGVLLRIDPGTAEIVESIHLEMRPTSMAIGAGRIWVLGWVGEGEKEVHVIDASTNATTDGSIVFDHLPTDIAFGVGSLWISHADAGTVTRLNAADIP